MEKPNRINLKGIGLGKILFAQVGARPSRSVWSPTSCAAMKADSPVFGPERPVHSERQITGKEQLVPGDRYQIVNIHSGAYEKFELVEVDSPKPNWINVREYDNISGKVINSTHSLRDLAVVPDTAGDGKEIWNQYNWLEPVA